MAAARTMNRSLNVTASMSAPNLLVPTATIHHRGENIVGTVVGQTGADLYVPRAMWTESVDSSLREREFDPEKFVLEEIHRQQRHSGMRKYLTQEMNRQLEERHPVKHAIATEKQEFLKNTNDEVERMVKEHSMQKEERERNRQALRAGLDAQVARNARRVEESRLQEAREAAELKMRTVKQLCDEVAEQNKQKKEAQREAVKAKQEREAKALRVQEARQSEVEDVRRAVQIQAIQEEQRLIAQQERLKAAQAGLDARSTISKAFLEAESKRREKEELRQERDQKKQQMLTDMHYTKRESARERQRHKMIAGLNNQVDVRKQQSIIPLIKKQQELDAVNESTRRNLEQELQKMYSKRVEHMELQNTLLTQMKEKEERAKSDGYKIPVAAATMLGSSSSSPAIGNRQKSPASDLMQRVDASRYMTKPLGRSAVDIERVHGFGGVAGVYGGGSAHTTALAATGGPMRILTKASDLAARDRQLQSNWSQGLTKQELRAGLKNAAKRGVAVAVDKSSTK